jgi:hypothetical protein
MNRHHRRRRHALAAARRIRAVRYDGESAVCGSCGTVYLKRDGHSC